LPSSVGASGVMAASAADAPTGRDRKFRGLLLRILSAVVLGPLLLAAVWYGFPWIDLVAAVVAPLLVREVTRLTRGRPVVRLSACIYVLAALVALLWLRHQPEMGRETVIWMLACTWATDIGAYFVGASAGGAKLAPRISPSKTWSGLIGGMAWAAVASAATGFAFGLGSTFSLAAIGAVLAVVAQLGDLAESALKRSAGVKDSGGLIPGHGGLLDRVDGLVAVLVAVAVVRLTTGGAWPWT
jgi:phosphatidate cytidylyltransferase